MSAISTATQYFDDLKFIPGVKRDDIDMPKKFSYWRKCILRITIGFWFAYALCDCCQNVQRFYYINTEIDKFPEIVRPQLKWGVIAASALELTVSLAGLWGLWKVTRALSERTNFALSSRYLVQAWFVLLFLAGLLYVAIPIAAFVDSALIEQDICTYSLVSVQQMGPPMRAVLAYEARSAIPDLAGALLLLPPATVAGIRSTPQHAWCGRDKNWRLKLFGPTQTSILGFGNPPAQGLFPSALSKLSLLMGVSLDVCDHTESVAKSLMEMDWSQHTNTMESMKDHIDTFTALNFTQAHLEMLDDKAERKLAEDRAHSNRLELHIQQQAAEIERLKAQLDAAEAVQHDPVVSKLSLLRKEQLNTVGRTLDVTDKVHLSVPHQRAVNPHRHIERPHDLLQLDALAVGGKEGINNKAVLGICAVNAGIKAYSFMSRVAPSFIQSLFGIYVSVKVVSTVLPVMSSFLTGVQLGIDNVKHALPTASLPGYMLRMLVLGAVPAMLAIMGVLSQSIGSVPAAIGITLLVTVQIHQIKIGAIYADVNGMGAECKDVLKKRIAKAKRSETMLYAACGASFSWLGVIMLKRLFDTGALDEAADSVYMFIKTFTNPVNLATMLFRYALMYYCSLAASTDIIMMITFDVMDDKINVKQDGELVTEKELVKQWTKFTKGVTLVDQIKVGGPTKADEEKKGKVRRGNEDAT